MLLSACTHAHTHALIARWDSLRWRYRRDQSLYFLIVQHCWRVGHVGIVQNRHGKKLNHRHHAKDQGRCASLEARMRTPFEAQILGASRQISPRIHITSPQWFSSVCTKTQHSSECFFLFVHRKDAGKAALLEPMRRPYGRAERQQRVDRDRIYLRCLLLCCDARGRALLRQQRDTQLKHEHSCGENKMQGQGNNAAAVGVTRRSSAERTWRFIACWPSACWTQSAIGISKSLKASSAGRKGRKIWYGGDG